jgi:hypothetical protein
MKLLIASVSGSEKAEVPRYVLLHGLPDEPELSAPQL